VVPHGKTKGSPRGMIDGGRSTGQRAGRGRVGKKIPRPFGRRHRKGTRTVAPSGAGLQAQEPTTSAPGPRDRPDRPAGSPPGSSVASTTPRRSQVKAIYGDKISYCGPTVWLPRSGPTHWRSSPSGRVPATQTSRLMRPGSSFPVILDGRTEPVRPAQMARIGSPTTGSSRFLPEGG